MRIFFAGIGCRGPSGKPTLWSSNLIDPLVRSGHEVIESQVDWERMLIYAESPAIGERARRAASARLIEEVARAHSAKGVDLFLGYLYDSHVEPGTIERIRKLGIPTVNFYCNAAHQFHLVREIAPAFDWCWVPERQALPSYRAAGARALHIQMAADPGTYRPVPVPARDIPVLFTGMLYADRADWLAPLVARGIPLQVYGTTGAPAVASGAPGHADRSLRSDLLSELRVHGVASTARRAARFMRRRRSLRILRPAMREPVYGDAMVALLSRAEATINLCNVYDHGRPSGAIKAHVRLRDFEAPMCRTLYFPQWCEELEEYYDTRREVVAWRTSGELAEKIQRYRADPAAAEAIREAGYRRALRDHTWERRYEQLFSLIGMKQA